jgi:T5orf172 domain.
MSHIYAIRIVDQPFVKIGWAVDPVRRMNNLSCGSPFRMELMATLKVDDAKKAEGEVHRALHRFRVRGEWFHLNEFVEAAISGWVTRKEVTPHAGVYEITVDDLKSVYPRTPSQEWMERKDQKILELRAEIAKRDKVIQDLKKGYSEASDAVRLVSATLKIIAKEQEGYPEGESDGGSYQFAGLRLRRRIENWESSGYTHTQIMDAL